MSTSTSTAADRAFGTSSVDSPASPRERCLELVDGPWSPSSSDHTADTLARRVGPPLVAAPGPVEPVGLWRYDTPEAYVADSPGIRRPAARVLAMRQAGFTGGVDVEFAVGADTYFVTVLGFAGNAAAVDYARVHLHDACEGVVEVAPLPEGDGIAYRRADGLVKAVFVVGGNEISVDVCSCTDDPDGLADAVRWASEVRAQAGQPVGDDAGPEAELVEV